MNKWKYDKVFSFVNDETGRHIATINFPKTNERGDFPDGWVDEMDRLGRLIANAPEMCELLREFCDGGGCFQCNFQCVKKARELLARIDGKEKN